jgi:hypothetical protein
MYSQNRAANQAAADTAANSSLLAQNQIDVANRNADATTAVAKANADATRAVAAYNARVAGSEAQQVALDTAANVRAMRKDARTFLSRQRSAFAGSGVRVDTGSPLAVQIATAGQLALQRAETYRQGVAREESIRAQSAASSAEAESRARLGMYEADTRANLTRYEGQKSAEATLITGQAQADAYHRAGTTAILNGASRMLATGYDLYQGGAFGGSAPAAPNVDNFI